MKIYVASSWRNKHQQRVVSDLRLAGHEVYDFRNPTEGDHGFHWSEVDPDWQGWSSEDFIEGLSHPLCEHGFGLDCGAMQWADACVLVMPCGRSAHLEAGFFAGSGKRLVMLLFDDCEFELMYKLADNLCVSVEEVIEVLAGAYR